MGRSRGNFHSPDEDPTQRSRRKKNANSGENSESAAAGQGTSEGKRALYHCNYCNKDITGKIRIKCFNCPDFDLCIECFSVGAEVQPHKSNHPYRVMDNLSFPLICPDWNADDEILLLEGIEMYGMGNWAEVAEHVGTKSKEQCIDHYTNKYKNSPYFPLPDMSHVVGKNRKELLAMAKGHSEDKKGFPMMGELNLKEESPFSPSRVKVEESHKGGSSSRLLSSLNAEVVSGVRSSSSSSAATAANKKASNMAQVKDGPGVIKVEVLEDFFHLRLEFYEKRKKFVLNKHEMELLKLENKVRFILVVVKGEIIVSNRKRADMFVELQTKGFTPFPKKTKAVGPEIAGATDDTEETEVKSPADSSCNGVQISDYEKVQELCAERDKLNKEVDDLRKETPKSF